MYERLCRLMTKLIETRCFLGRDLPLLETQFDLAAALNDDKTARVIVFQFAFEHRSAEDLCNLVVIHAGLQRGESRRGEKAGLIVRKRHGDSDGRLPPRRGAGHADPYVGNSR